MTRRTITTSHAAVSCDVCGRTLLRGEQADPFIAGGSRRLVCELCTARATNEGWIREGLDDAPLRRNGREGRRSIFKRLRGAGRREAPPPAEEVAPRRGARYVERVTSRREDEGLPPDWSEQEQGAEASAADAPEPAPAPAPRPPVAEEPPPPPAEPAWEPPREPRHVRAVPTNADLKMSRACEVFNASEHPRTVAGVARSLGAPIVHVRPSATEGSVVTIVVAWDLSWYRYEVDLVDEASGVRVTEQGTELSELSPEEQVPNAAADERGSLVMAA